MGQWLNAHPNKKDVISEAGSTILSMKEANEKNLTRECDQVWNMISASIRDLERASAVKIREIESE